MKHYIYKITNLINDKYYIGKHSSEDIQLDNYMGSGNLIQLALRKYGISNFKRQILFEYQDQNQAYQKQKELVNQNMVKNPNSYNIRIGGLGFDSNYVMAKDIQGNINLVHIEEFNTNPELVGVSKGTIVAKDKNGNCHRVKKTDERLFNGQLIPNAKGMVAILDKNNDIRYVTSDQKRLQGLKSVNNETIVVFMKDLNQYKRISLDQFNRNRIMYKTVNQGRVSCYNENNQLIRVLKDEFTLNKDKLRGVTKGYAFLKDKDGNTIKVSTSDPRYLSGQLFGSSKNTVLVKQNGKCFRVNKKEWNKELLPSANLGRVPVKDKEGHTFSVSKDDPRYISGELKFISCGTVNVRDKDGNTMRVATDDARYISGELIPAGRGKQDGKIMAKDKFGNHYRVERNDPRWLSGELVGIASKKFKRC